MCLVSFLANDANDLPWQQACTSLKMYGGKQRYKVPIRGRPADAGIPHAMDVILAILNLLH